VRSLRFIAEHKDHREPSLGRRAATEGAPPLIVTREVTRQTRLLAGQPAIPRPQPAPHLRNAGTGDEPTRSAHASAPERWQCWRDLQARRSKSPASEAAVMMLLGS
jgi:hypothetical protein